jgi:predicted NAD/FAD-binding protein
VKVAVVGGGVSGLVAAYLLSSVHDVKLFERNSYFGGHSNTVTVSERGEDVHLDTGFLVYNEPAYPLFSRLLAQLGVTSRPSDMSFSVSCRACSFEFSSRGLRGFLARPVAMLQPSRVRLALDIARFYREAPRILDDAGLRTLTLEEHLRLHRYGDEFRRHFILPLAAAVWSTPPGRIGEFPASHMLRFLYNHGLIGGGEGRWRWRTVAGGSRVYVAALIDRIGAALKESKVNRVRRSEDCVSLEYGGAVEAFDAVVLACHADEALELLEDASAEERDALACFTYTRNRIVLHTDAALLPSRRAARASWNYLTSDCRAEGADLALTYHLNRLQSIAGGTDYCVSVNADLPIKPEATIEELYYDHPSYTFDTFAGQERVGLIQGARRTFYAGAHLGFGFHEDGVASAYRVASMLGVTV